MDYHPFGWEMPGRKYNSSEYRYGFNGKEKDDDGEFGSITNYDYGFRIYNPAIGRFLSVDPLTQSYPFYTPYQFAANSPIGSIDLDGLESLLKHKPIFEYKPVFKNGPSSVLEKASNAGHNFMAIPSNIYIGSGNTLRGIWNFGVNLYTGEYNNSTATEVMIRMDLAMAAGARKSFDYHTTTPFSQQLIDAFDDATDPKTLQLLVELYAFGGKQMLDDLAKGSAKGLSQNTGIASSNDVVGLGAKLGDEFANINKSGSRFNCVGCAIEADKILRGVKSLGDEIPFGSSSKASIAEGDLVSYAGQGKFFGKNQYRFSGIQDEMVSSGSGSTGIVVGKRSTGFDHAFNVTYDKGVMKVVDIQNGKAYVGKDNIDRFIKAQDFNGTFEFYNTTKLSN